MKFYTAFERKILMTKYVVMLCDGMADYPVEELGGKSPMGPLISLLWISWLKKLPLVW